MSKSTLTNERCSKIRKYVTQLVYYNGKNIKEEWKPKNEEEQKFFEKIYKWELEDKEKEEDYQNRYNLAIEQAEEILKKYRKKEYWSNGIFSYFKLNKYKKEIAPDVKKFMKKIEKEKIEPYYSLMYFNEKEVNHVIYQLYYEQIELQLLEEKYGINSSYLEKGLPKKYYEEIDKIQDKYKVVLPEYFNM